MAKAARVALDAQGPFADAAAETVRVRAGELIARLEGPLDVDGVHDARVASRRLRAALEIYAPCFPAKRHRRVLREVKRLADGLGARRDPDVALGAIEQIAAELGVAGRDDVARLRSEILAERDRGDATVAAALARVRERDLHGALLALAEAAR